MFVIFIKQMQTHKLNQNGSSNECVLVNIFHNKNPITL